MAFLILLMATKTLADDEILPEQSVINRPVCDPVLNSNQNESDCFFRPLASKIAKAPNQVGQGHSTRNSKPISEDTIRGWLNSQTSKGRVGSPLAEYSAQIAASPYSSTILAICYIEQNHCVSAPGFNYWGIGPGKRYKSQEEGIAAINAFLERSEANHPTIESMRHWYCYAGYTESHICPGWEETILKIKAQIESL